MMLLNKLYSEPEGLFQTIEFKNGVNFIFAKKDKSEDNKNSLNGIGKSLLLNFLDYCLLSSETEHIKSAKKHNELDDFSVVLEFEIDQKTYIIKRPFKTPNNNIMFGIVGEELKKYDIPQKNVDKELNKKICDLIFKNKNYQGKYSNTWLRKLIPFFVKKQENPKTKVNFIDPIKFSRSTEMECISFHLFFMGINNSLFWKNFEIKSDLKTKDVALEEVKNIVQETYNLKDIAQAENTIDKIKSQVTEYEDNIKNFQLANQYKDIENQSNELTAKIKELWYQNNLDQKKIESYKSSYALDSNIKTIKIKNIYKDLNNLLAVNIKKTLDEAIKFRENISDSRRDFLAAEISNLEKEIQLRSNKIIILETERTRIFNFQAAKEAIRDLSEAYFDLSKRREKLSSLEGKIKLYQDLKSEVAERDAAITKLYSEIVIFTQVNKDSFSQFRKMFFDIHNAIYPENKDKNFGFIFEANPNKDSKVNMDVFLPADLSKGKNNGRSLIYDLAILFNAIKNNINCPHFLIHDGVFDGMDKTQFIYLYEYLEKLSNVGVRFQYIITLNEEGTLSNNFGNADKVTPEKIEKEAIITLKPSKKLLNKSWD